MKTLGPSVWDQFDIEEYKVSLQASASPGTSPVESPEPGADRLGLLGRRWFWKTLNVIATTIWLYALLKLFVVDLDRWIVTSVAPSWLWILDFRFFLFLLLATLLFVFTRRWKAVLVLAYILLFPLILLVWWLPRLYIQRKSWDLVLGSLQVFWSLGQSLRFTFVTSTVFAFATRAIALDGPVSLLRIAVVALVVLWSWLMFRAVVYAIAPSKFVVYQQKLLGNVLDSSIVWNMTALPPAAKSPDVPHLSKGEIDRAVSNASTGLALYALSALWAEKLNQYRKSGMSVLFSAFGVVALLAQGMILFAVVNLGIYRIDATEFAYSETPRIATFLRYSISSMYAGEIEALQPVGTWASWVSVGTTFSCAIVVMVLIVSLIFSLKQSRDDLVAEASIRAMRSKADAFAEKLIGEYKLPLIDLLDRIAELNGLFSNWTRQIVHALIVSHRESGDKHKRP